MNIFNIHYGQQSERFKNTCNELLTWAEEHDVDIQIRTDCRLGLVTVTLAADGLRSDIQFYKHQLTTYAARDVFDILQFYYEDLVDRRESANDNPK